MHYKFFSVEDFIRDEFFQHWVYSPSEERNQYWSAFLLHYPAQRAKVEAAREFLLAMDFSDEVQPSHLNNIKLNFNAAIDQYEGKQKAAVPPGRERRLSLRSRLKLPGGLYPIAASLLLIAVFTGYVILENNLPAKMLKALTMEKQKTPQGKKRQVILADGTHVWLNANSELSYSSDFFKREVREVYLQGEAFFDVAENKEKPFIVHASGLEIKVLGTAFNVRSYAADPVVETTLVRGKVSIFQGEEPNLPPVTLLPNQQALFSKDSKTIALEDVANTENFTGWKNGWMIFDNKPFSYIKETLERWYDVTITMEDEHSLSCTFSAKFKDKTLQEVLEIFRSTESINYRIDGDHVFINGRLCQYENQN